MDKVSPAKRSRIMKAVRRQNTAPEWVVRRLLHSLGYRFRLHAGELPGSPDVVFPARRKVILVHGCFWHSHDCRKSLVPQSRQEFWGPKIERNKARDREDETALRKMGWNVLIVWECQTVKKQRVLLETALRAFLGPTGKTGVVQAISGKDASRPLNEGGCPLVKS